jgi:O-antigen/teichoic acid export membrane protein
MLKRVFWVALFTGLSHLISIITISYVLRNLGEETSGYLGVIDSTIVFVSTIISFGIQLAVNRNVATSTSWKSNYKLGQSSRLMLSFFVLAFGVVAYIFEGNINLLIYCYAPLIALNGDYALYGNGKPIIAASLSFLRVALPNLGIIVCGHYFGPDVLPIYILLLALGTLTTGFIAAYFNGVSYFYMPRKHFLKFYFKYSKIGVYQVVGVLLVPSILVVANWFYSIAIIGLINGLLKLLIVYKGGLRIIVQTFFKEIKEERTDLKIDKASLIAWGAISIPIIIYFKTTLFLLFDHTYDDIASILPFIGGVMFLAAFRNASEAKALIQKKDNLNLYVFLVALLIEIVVIILFSYTSSSIWGIPIGLFIAELTIVLGLGFGLNKIKFFTERLRFIGMLLPPLVLAFTIKFFLGESYITLGASVIIYGVWSLVFFRKLIFGSLTKMDT